MCSIIGSYNKETIRELSEINEYRGQHSHSLFVLSTDFIQPEIIYRHQALGPLKIDDHKLPEGYIIGHQQAPTTENRLSDTIHPAEVENQYLWHNGIIKEKEIERLQKKLNEDSSWDTMLILKQLIVAGTPNNIDGTFNCAWLNGTLKLFRNEISPMFYNDKFDISSTKFKGSKPLDPNKVFKVDLTDKSMEEITQFSTTENPYYFG